MVRHQVMAGILSVVGLFAWANGALAEEPKPAKPAAVRDDNQNPATVKRPPRNGRHDLFLNRIARNLCAGDVIFLGDSITECWDENFLENSAVWQRHLGGFNPVNLGSGGDQTGHVLWRISDLDGEGRELVDLNPKVAVLLIGINNISQGGGDNAQIAGGIAAIVAELKRQKPRMKILVLGILPSNARAAAINAMVSTLHDGETVFFKDIGSQLVDSTGTLSLEYSTDRIHLNPAGYDLAAKAIGGELVGLTASTVAYHANGAESGTAPVSQSQTQGVAVAVSGNTGHLVKANHTFYGWNTAADGTGTDYVEGAAYSANASVTLYARWVPTAQAGAVVAMGGMRTNYVVSGTHYQAHIFTTSGQRLKVYTPVVVEYLVVGGGGGGGGGYADANCRGGGGGGAGGYRSAVGGETSGHGARAETPLTLGAGTYEIGVGAGGRGGVPGRPSTSGENGQDSYIKNPSAADLVRSAGGGGGAGVTNNAASAGNAGGSGGGSTTDGTAGPGTANQGHAGGVGGGGRVSGGGGGAGGVGLPNGSAGTDAYGKVYTKGHGGSGGTGVWSKITGSAIQRAGGGGGGRDSGSYENGMGGGGGGGNGGSPAASYTGGGGGGGSDQGSGCAGGSGIVIVRYVVGGGTTNRAPVAQDQNDRVKAE